MKVVPKFMRFAFIFFLMFSILGLSSPQILSSSASTSATIDADVKEGLYFIRNVYSGKYLDVCQRLLYIGSKSFPKCRQRYAYGQYDHDKQRYTKTDI